MNKKQEQKLWELYASAGNKDVTFQLARQDQEAFPDGITRDGVRAVLNGPAPEGFFPDPKILYIDIETAPMEALVWRLYKENVHDDGLMADWYILSWAAAWNDGKVFSDYLANHPPWQDQDYKNDFYLLSSLWRLLDEADIVVAHNGDRFDIPRINTRFLTAQMPPPSPYQSVDTLQVIRRKFNFGSNKLVNVAKFLEIAPKGHNGGMETWAACMRGDNDAMNVMRKYNEEDITSLRELYKRIRAWAPSHPNFGVITQREWVCPCCGSHNLTEGEKPYRTPAGSYPTWRCNDCGASSRERTTEIPKDIRKGLLVPLAR